MKICLAREFVNNVKQQNLMIPTDTTLDKNDAACAMYLPHGKGYDVLVEVGVDDERRESDRAVDFADSGCRLHHGNEVQIRNRRFVRR